MSKIKIHPLHSILFNASIQQLTANESANVMGSGYPYWFNIINITDTVSINTVGGNNTINASKNSISYHDNSFHSIDYSQSNHNILFYGNGI